MALVDSHLERIGDEDLRGLGTNAAGLLWRIAVDPQSLAFDSRGGIVQSGIAYAHPGSQHQLEDQTECLMMAGKTMRSVLAHGACASQQSSDLFLGERFTGFRCHRMRPDLLRQGDVRKRVYTAEGL